MTDQTHDIVIESKGFGKTRIYIDGHDIAKYATKYELYQSAVRMPVLTVEVMAADMVVELSGRVTYTAYAWGYQAAGATPVECLESLLQMVRDADNATNQVS